MSPDERAVGAYLGLAVGDALGATVEFMTPREIRVQYGVHRNILGGGWLKLPKGRVTDDTEMTLALGDSIIGHGRVDAVEVARAFDNWMRSRPVDIGNTVRRGLLRFRQSGEAEVPANEHDGGNGACMRVLPVALWGFERPWPETRSGVLAQAHVTHNNPLSDAGTLCITEMVQMALGGGSIQELLHGPVKKLLERFSEFTFRKKRRDNPSGFIVDTLQVVFQALFDTESFEECVVEAVNRGGDADTTGAIAGMVAGALYGPKAIPRRWLKATDGDVLELCRRQALALITRQI